MWRIQAKHETVCPRCKGYIRRACGSFKRAATADGDTRCVQRNCDARPRS